MPDEVKIRRARKWLWLTAIGVFLLAVMVGLLWYVRSPAFADFVRSKVVETIEDATGGRVEMASFRWNLRRLAFETDDLTIHGLEPPDQLPYAHVDRALIRLHIISFLERRVSLEQLELQHPVIHVIVNADGSTNAPEPKVRPQGNKSSVQELFDLAIARTDLRDGMLIINDKKFPLDFAANDVLAAMTFERAAQRYDGSLQIGKIDVKYQDFRDVPASADFQFSLWHNVAQLKSLRFTSEKSTLQASGKLTNFQQPQIQITYSSTLDVVQAGAITRSPQLRAGTLLLDGLVDYSESSGLSSTGRIAFRDLDYVDDGIAIRRANLNSNFSFANNRLALTRIAARGLGGEVTGDADIANLVAPITTKPEPAVAESKTTGKRRAASTTAAMNGMQQEGSGRFHISGLSLNEVARMFSSRSLPLDKLNAVGRVTGTVNLTWKQDLAHSLADLALDVAAPTQVAGNQMSIAGSLRGRYSVFSGRIDLAGLNLTTPHTRLDATGSMGATTAALKLKADTTSLADFQPLLTAMGNSPPPIELDGSLGFDGTVNGRLRAPGGRRRVVGGSWWVEVVVVVGAAAAACGGVGRRRRRWWWWWRRGSAVRRRRPARRRGGGGGVGGRWWRWMMVLWC